MPRWPLLCALLVAGCAVSPSSDNECVYLSPTNRCGFDNEVPSATVRPSLIIDLKDRPGPVHVQVVDDVGREIFSKRLARYGELSVAPPFNGLSRGRFWVRVFIGDSEVEYKLLVGGPSAPAHVCAIPG